MGTLFWKSILDGAKKGEKMIKKESESAYFVNIIAGFDAVICRPSPPYLKNYSDTIKCQSFFYNFIMIC